MMTLMHILAMIVSLSTGQIQQLYRGRNTIIVVMGGWLMVLTVVVVLDDFTPPGVVVLSNITFSRHLKPILDLAVRPAVYLEGADDYLRNGQDLGEGRDIWRMLVRWGDTDQVQPQYCQGSSLG